ncbi:MAG: type II toxin-antitoxin system prevent-host-death family antitoxin [Thermomicrobiales bacterium]|nr:type II toxin-antitoxin system prevent-host-death family antitoxin [Thermomicrobiales bacterium]
MTQTMKISEVKTHLNALVNRVYRDETRVLVEKSGIPVAALVSTADLARLDRLDRERDERFSVLDELQAAFADEDPGRTERETNRITSEIRAEGRSSREATIER